MHKMLLAAAASLAALVVPASATAQDRANVTVHSGDGAFQARFGGHDGHRDHDGDRHDRRGNGGSGGLLIDGWDREYQGDTAWRADSFNDWWHEQPWRSYPRWVQDNHNCQPSRMWWSGSGWHC